MRSILMIAYFFPPEASAGMHRPLRFLRELSKNGWHATVICADPYLYERYDPKTLTLVPQEARIIRVRGRDLWQSLKVWTCTRLREGFSKASPEMKKRLLEARHSPFRTRLRELVESAESWYYRPDMAMPWIRPATREAIRECEGDRPDVIWATIGPLSSGLVAYRASLRTGVPFVLDFRDPWGLNYFDSESRRPAWAKYLDNRITYRILKHARSVIFVSKSMAQCYSRFFNGALEARKIHIIPNGFEGEIEDFAHASGDKCRILYTGTLSTYRYETFLQALRVFKMANYELAKQLQVLFVGEGEEDLNTQVANLGISDMVQTAPPTSFTEINRLQRAAHALLLLGRDPARKGYELLTGAKLFGYLKAGRPIFGVLPRDETRRKLNGVGVSTIADVESASDILAVLEKIVSAWSSGTLRSLVPNRAACEVYSARRQTRALISALEGAPAERPLVPESSQVPLSGGENLAVRRLC